MPKEVHDCVQDLLSKDDFYPDKSESERESAAWGICQERHGAKGTLEPVTFKTVDEVGEITVEATEDDGEILLFKNAVLCREAVNANQDEIAAGEIENLANTIAGRPIDNEHEERDIRGVFTAGRKVDRNGIPALSVDGLIWVDRYPQEANDVRSGRRKLSIEAVADSAECSVCNQMFARSSEYCDHLRNKRKTGAVRRLFGLKAKGGALTYSPAEKQAGFDIARIMMVASHDEDGLETISSEQKELEMGEKELKEQLDEMTAKLETVNQEKEELAAKVSELEQKLQDEGEKLAASQTAQEELQSKLEAAESNSAKYLEQVRKARLSGSISEEEWESKKETIMAMSDDAFELVASLGAKKPSQEPRNPQDFHELDGEEDKEQKVKLVL